MFGTRAQCATLAAGAALSAQKYWIQNTRGGPWINQRRSSDLIRKTCQAVGATGASITYGYYNMARIMRRVRKGRYKARTGRYIKRRSLKYGRRYNRPRKVGRRRGRRFTGGGARAGRPLNTNFARNDYRTVRVCQRIGEIRSSVGQPFNTYTFGVDYDTLMEQWPALRNTYRQYYVKNLSLVLEPRTIAKGATNIRITGKEIPYVVIRTLNPTTTTGTGSVNVELLRQTPGCRYIPMMGRKRTIHNIKPSTRIQRTFAVEPTDVNSYKYERLPWLNTTAAGRTIQFAAVSYTTPDLANAGTTPDFEMWWDVVAYATVTMRGNFVEVLDPINL